MTPLFAAEAPRCAEWEGVPVKEITWEGLQRVRPEVVERESRVVIGTPLECRDLERTRLLLEGLDLFAEVRYGVDAEGDSAMVRWFVQELPPWLPLPSAKISDQDGWLIGPSVIGLNLLGRDIRLEAHARVTLYPEWLRAQEYTFSLSSPWLGSWPVEYDLRLIRTDSWNPLKQYDERSWELGAEFARRLFSGWSLLLWSEAFQVEHVDREGTWSFSSSDHHDRAGVIGLGVRRDRRDRSLDTRNGEWLELKGGRAGDPLGNSGAWGDYLIDLRLWRSFGDALILHGSSLVRWRPGDVPYTLYYHQGGINSLRGYASDVDRASRDELLTTLELRWPLIERRPFRLGSHSFFAGLQVVAGVDAARQGFGQEDSGYVGFFGGFHLLLPGLDRLRLESGWSRSEGFSIALGLYEKSVTQRWRGR